MKRLISILALIISLSAGANSQYNYFHPEIFYLPSFGPEKFYADKLDNNVSDNPGLQYRMQAGVIFSSVNNYNSLTNWFSPKVMLPIGSKFMVEVGGIYTSSSIIGSGDGDLRRINDLVAYARGIYAVNENLTVYGQVARSMMKDLFPGDVGFESITMGMEYYVTPNFRIGASVTSQKGMDPFYLNSPYRNNYRSQIPGLYY